MKKILLATLFLFFSTTVFASITAMAGSIGLQWNPSPETDINGYKLYYTEEGSGVEQSVNVGNVTSYKLDGLTTNKFYLIEATAYDLAGNESKRSYGVRVEAEFGVVTGLEAIQ